MVYIMKPDKKRVPQNAKAQTFTDFHIQHFYKGEK